MTLSTSHGTTSRRRHFSLASSLLLYGILFPPSDALLVPKSYSPRTTPFHTRAYGVLTSTTLLANSKKGENPLTPTNEEGKSSSSSRASQSSSDGGSDNSNPKHKIESFATGEELKQLRSDVSALRERLRWLEVLKDANRASEIKDEIIRAERRDPDIMYEKTLEEIRSTKSNFAISKDEKANRLSKLEKQAEETRKHLARFQLEGLWVGCYGQDRGEQLINVTYDGDTLIATKVNGDAHIPRGQVSFSASLAPSGNITAASKQADLDIQRRSPTNPRVPSLSSSSSQNVAKFKGKGHVAKRGFKERKQVDGELMILDVNFSFVWIPSGFHVLFQRPTPTQVLNLMRDDMSKEDELDNMREHLERCFHMDMTESIARMYADADELHEVHRRILTRKDLLALDQRAAAKQEKTSKTDSPETGSPWNLLQMNNNWLKYIGNLINDDEEIARKRKYFE